MLIRFMIFSQMMQLTFGQAVLSNCPIDVSQQNPNEPCYTLQESPHQVLSFDDALVYCQSRLFRYNRQQHPQQLAIIRTPDDLASLAKLMAAAGWSRAMIGLRRMTSHWRWAFDAALLRGQGCRSNPLTEDAVTNGPSTSISNLFSLDLTHQVCADFCKSTNKAYYAVEAANLCRCSNDFLWSESSDSCTSPCSGDASQVCGSFSASSVFASQELAYDNWKPGYPLNQGNCAVLQVSKISGNSWLDANCSDKMSFLCQFSPHWANSTLTAGYSRRTCADGVCYYLFSAESLSWYEADRYCLARQGRLAAIGHQERQDMLNAMLFDGKLDGTQFWIGATNQDWYFASSKSVQNDQRYKPAFNGWLPTASDKNYDSNAMLCVELVVKSQQAAGWRSRSCQVNSGQNEQSLRFICSRDLSEVGMNQQGLPTNDSVTKEPPLIYGPAVTDWPDDLEESIAKQTTPASSRSLGMNLASSQVNPRSVLPGSSLTDPGGNTLSSVEQILAKLVAEPITSRNDSIKTENVPENQGTIDTTNGTKLVPEPDPVGPETPQRLIVLPTTKKNVLSTTTPSSLAAEASKQCKDAAGTSVPWWDIFLIVLLAIASFTAATFVALYLLERKKFKELLASKNGSKYGNDIEKDDSFEDTRVGIAMVRPSSTEPPVMLARGVVTASPQPGIIRTESRAKSPGGSSRERAATLLY